MVVGRYNVTVPTVRKEVSLDHGDVGDLRFLPCSVLHFLSAPIYPATQHKAQGVSFIATSNTAALSSREPTSAGTPRDTNGVQVSDKRYAAYFQLL